MLSDNRLDLVSVRTMVHHLVVVPCDEEAEVVAVVVAVVVVPRTVVEVVVEVAVDSEAVVNNNGKHSNIVSTCLFVLSTCLCFRVRACVYIS